MKKPVIVLLSTLMLVSITLSAICIVLVKKNITGKESRRVAVQCGQSAIQWKYDNETEWHDLVDIAQLTGAAGPAGQDGKNGTNGKDGIDGRNGANGKDGVNGKDGTDGKDGVNGKDQMPVTTRPSRQTLIKPSAPPVLQVCFLLQSALVYRLHQCSTGIWSLHRPFLFPTGYNGN